METNQEWTTGTVQFSLNGEPVEMQMTVPARPVRLRRMLPIFQQMTDSFLEVGIGKIEAQGKQVSCAKGCGACCRQLIPVSEAETLLLAELVEQMPEPRRSLIKEQFNIAARHFHETGWLARVDRADALPPAELQKLADEYFAENIPCPFLEDEACSIHPHRPLVCREYLVTSPAEFCADPQPETIERVKLLFLISNVILNVENKNNRKPINFVPLILALAFAGRSGDGGAAAHEKTGEQWLADFFEELSKTTA